MTDVREEELRKAIQLATQRNVWVYSCREDEDYLVTMWHQEMIAKGEFDRTFLPDSRPLGTFLSYFRPPNVLLYTPAQDGLIFTMWFQPSWFGAFMGMWSREGHRATKGNFFRCQAGFAVGFAMYRHLGSITWQERLLRIHRRIGFTVIDLPRDIFDKQVWLLFFSRNAFESSIMNPWRQSARENNNPTIEVKDNGWRKRQGQDRYEAALPGCPACP